MTDRYVSGDTAASLFSPSRETGVALRQSLNREFLSSFAHVLGACGEHFDVPERQVENLLSRIGSGSRETPFMFSLHFELLEAIQDDRLEDVQDLITRILNLPPAAPGILLTSLIPDEFPWDCDVVARYFAADDDSVFRFVAPAPDKIPKRWNQINATLELVRDAVPGLADEIEELVTTIILARGVPIEEVSEPTEAGEGASALRAFGAVLQNVKLANSVVDCANSLIHEEAHTVLFALSPMDGVVTNSHDERYTSPLRDDPRPLEGIYHATFVLARMVYGMEALQSSERLTPSERATAADILETNRSQFFDGLKTLRRHADFTKQGASALEAAEAYMASFA